MQNQEKYKQSRLTTKSQVDDIEGQVNEIRKRMNSQQKELTAIQKQISAQETKMEQKRADRHSLLKTCKVRATCKGIKKTHTCVNTFPTNLTVS